MNRPQDVPDDAPVTADAAAGQIEALAALVRDGRVVAFEVNRERHFTDGLTGSPLRRQWPTGFETWTVTVTLGPDYRAEWQPGR